MSRDHDNIPADVRSALEEDSSVQAEPSDDRRDWEVLWSLLAEAAPSDEALPDADETWEAIQRQVAEDPETADVRRATDRSPSRPHARSSGRRPLWRWGSAAVATLVLLLAIWWWMHPVSVTAPAGTTLTHTLPDGSTIELHGDTQLSYSRSFSSISLLEADHRLVELDGEAYFDVSSRDRPFVVETPSVRIEVLGTSFSVRSRRGETNDAHVALAEGRLRVTDRTDPSTEVTLAPGQVTTRTAQGALSAARDTSLQRILAWRRGGFAVTAQPLPDIARSLERRFGQSIRLHASIDGAVRSDPLTLYYPQSATLEAILRDVCMARGLTYRATATGYVLESGNERHSARSR